MKWYVTLKLVYYSMPTTVWLIFLGCYRQIVCFNSCFMGLWTKVKLPTCTRLRRYTIYDLIVLPYISHHQWPLVARNCFMTRCRWSSTHKKPSVLHIDFKPFLGICFFPRPAQQHATFSEILSLHHVACFHFKGCVRLG